MSGGGGVQISQGERGLADLSQEQWLDYKKSYQPLDAQMLTRAQDKNRARTIGSNMATGGAGQAFDQADASVMRNLSASGANPNSGRGISAISNMKRARGVSVGRAGVGSEIEADKRYAGGMFNAAAHGRGVKGIALNGINTTARISSQNAIYDAKFKADESAAMINGISKAAGAAATAGMAATAPGANGEASGWETFKNARASGATFGEASGMGFDQTRLNNRSGR